MVPMIQIGKIKDNLYRNIQIIEQNRASRFHTRRFVRPLSGRLLRESLDRRCRQSPASAPDGCAAMEITRAEKADAAPSLTAPSIQALRGLYLKTGRAPPHRTLSVFPQTTDRSQVRTHKYLLSSNRECLNKLSAAPPMSMRIGCGAKSGPCIPRPTMASSAEDRCKGKEPPLRRNPFSGIRQQICLTNEKSRVSVWLNSR